MWSKECFFLKKKIDSLGFFSLTGFSLALICSHALTMAGPLRSAPVLPAVTVVLAMVSVEVLVVWILSTGTPRAREHTCIILVWRPWPISMPPWWRSTEPSV